MNVFFISNSTCYFFTDELYEMLVTAGYEDVNLCLVYYSGCSLKTHYEWWQSDEANYRFCVWNKDGYQATEGYSLKKALDYLPWDVIVFSGNSKAYESLDTETSLAGMEPYLAALLKDIRNMYPDPRYCWIQAWGLEVGYTLAFPINTVEHRDRVYETRRSVAKALAERWQLDRVPCGDAWQKVRDLPLFTTPIEGLPIDRFTLNTRIRNGKLWDDFAHDGDMGGGQYLNACVWFEFLTGKSCLDNCYRPKYEYEGIDCSLTEEKIRVLKNAAHEAMAELD